MKDSVFYTTGLQHLLPAIFRVAHYFWLTDAYTDQSEDTWLGTQLALALVSSVMASATYLTNLVPELHRG